MLERGKKFFKDNKNVYFFAIITIIVIIIIFVYWSFSYNDKKIYGGSAQSFVAGTDDA